MWPFTICKYADQNKSHFLLCPTLCNLSKDKWEPVGFYIKSSVFAFRQNMSTSMIVDKCFFKVKNGKKATDVGLLFFAGFHRYIHSGITIRTVVKFLFLILSEFKRIN